ncbi:MAG: amino acid carrier protein [Myxococcota bacterium]
MIDATFAALESVNDFLWGYVGVALILGGGALVSRRLGWVQLRAPTRVLLTALSLLRQPSSDTSNQQNKRGVAPARAFFASLGGCVGIGNLAGVAVGVQIGGPGVLVWMWIVALLGMALKYGEVYLGMTTRRPNEQGSYDGGPMYVLAQAFPSCQTWLPKLAAGLLCLYGVEIYLFGVIKETAATSWSLPAPLVSALLLALVILGTSGGVRRIGAISGILVPLFGLAFLAMTLWIVLSNASKIPALLATIFQSAFRGHSAVDSFAGSTFILVVSRGLATACYSGDVGIGYASIIHSESRSRDPCRQASLSMLDIALDTFICTCAALLVLLTGVWHEPVNGNLAVQVALAKTFPYMHVFMPMLFFCLGYTTLLAYMIAGLKCAAFLNAKWGKKVYWGFATVAFTVFSFVEPHHALSVMLFAGGLLMILNCGALLRLRSKIHFAPADPKTPDNASYNDSEKAGGKASCDSLIPERTSRSRRSSARRGTRMFCGRC